ncbi:Mannan endo-1,4-beta-mannosidase precursor [compost metagenome]
MQQFLPRKAGVKRKVISILLLFTLIAPNFPFYSNPSSAASIPVNPSASAEAKGVLQYLYDISGSYMLSGQHDYLESPDEFNDLIKSKTGQYAGIHGYELGPIMNQSSETVASQRQEVVNSAIKWHQAGGLVTITFHQSVPGKCKCWSNVKTQMSQSEFNQWVTPGTTAYKKLITDLDEVAVYLKQLKEAKVPVLWRPYHEMNGDWFWWGKKNNYSTLWNIMFDRFVNTHKLNNLLWVWSPNAPNASSDPYESTYPGSDKVDVLAADIYDHDYQQTYYDQLVELAKGKPVAIGENAEIPSHDIIQNQPKWAYMMTWGQMLNDNNTSLHIKSFYAHSKVLTRGFVPKRNEAASQNPKRQGLRAEYYDNKDFTSFKEFRQDSTIDFNWRQLAPLPSMEPDTFSVRWTGKLKPTYTETYKIHTVSDDGIRVWVNGTLVIDSWFNQSWVERTGIISLQAGQAVDFKVEYYDNKDGALARVYWSSASQVKEIIPESALFQP